jgi:hypothetical protein
MEDEEGTGLSSDSASESAASDEEANDGPAKCHAFRGIARQLCQDVEDDENEGGVGVEGQNPATDFSLPRKVRV